MFNSVDHFAKETGVDAQAMRDMVAFLKLKAAANPELFQRDPKLFIEMGMREYKDRIINFYFDVMTVESERGKSIRAKLATEVWYESQQV